MTSATSTVPALLDTVTYTDSNDRTKAALVVGTPESTAGRIAEGHVSVVIFNPVTGNRYFRFAALDAETGTYKRVAAGTASPSHSQDADDPEDGNDPDGAIY
jgi:hypothetical protein